MVGVNTIDHSAERVRVALQRAASLSEIQAIRDADVLVETTVNEMIARITAFLLRAEKQKSVRYDHVPADWFSHLRLTKFPAWLNRRWPPKLRPVEVRSSVEYHACPHLQTDSDRLHFSWLAGD